MMQSFMDGNLSGQERVFSHERLLIEITLRLVELQLTYPTLAVIATVTELFGEQLLVFGRLNAASDDPSNSLSEAFNRGLEVE